jgi:hypothetical protein
MKLIKIALSFVLTLDLSANELEFDGRIELVAPKRSSWTIKFLPTKAMRIEEKQKSRVAKIDDSLGISDTNQKSLTSLRVEKSGNLYFELSRFSDGSKKEKWMLGSLQFYEIEEGGQLAMPVASLVDSEYSDRSKEDFEELGWLSKDFYKGIIQFNGETCFHFSTTTDKAPETRRQKAIREFYGAFEESSVGGKTKVDKASIDVKQTILPITVIISAVNRLPLLYDDGKTIRTYTYQTDNLGPISPPEKFMREFKGVEKVTLEAKKRVIPQ